jgi:hypothetical protein
LLNIIAIKIIEKDEFILKIVVAHYSNNTSTYKIVKE